MPARTVVLEKLTKWNGESHVSITPGEYTQLTGRAGRRGIDIEGNAVKHAIRIGMTEAELEMLFLQQALLQQQELTLEQGFGKSLPPRPAVAQQACRGFGEVSCLQLTVREQKSLEIGWIYPVVQDFIESLNPNSLKVITAIVEPSLANALPDQKFQFERHGYFVADRVDHVQGSKPVFNLAVGLKDSWGK